MSNPSFSNLHDVELAGSTLADRATKQQQFSELFRGWASLG